MKSLPAAYKALTATPLHRQKKSHLSPLDFLPVGIIFSTSIQ
jgi:hypothetical protein